jgi:outer membrane receptor protein involved in Fe transport
MGSFFKPFTFIANYTRIVSNVELGDLTNSESLETNRPMQGQSDYTANALLDYESEVLGTNASLAYNVYGERRVYPGREGLPNIWELPFHQLNFVLRQKMGKKWSLQFKAKNLLDQRVQFVQGDRIWQAYRPGISVNLGVGISI